LHFISLIQLVKAKMAYVEIHLTEGRKLAI